VACRHKFAGDLYLQGLDFIPTVLIIGTFNPAWEQLANTATWFYGRPNNYFWDVLPRLYGNPPLRQAGAKAWRNFCKQHHIALTDVLYSIGDANASNAAHIQTLKTYRDDAIAKHFHEFVWVDVIAILKRHRHIQHVYFTRQASGFWQPAWQTIAAYCQDHQITCHTLLTPSAHARFQMPKQSGQTLADFIYGQWQQHWHVIGC
jgi:G:T/U-mismatch repair DNA glycosylase